MTNKKGNHRGARNRVVGHDGERYYASEFRRMGFNYTKTSRAASRLHDDSGIDLCFTDPFNVQIKTGNHRGLIVSKELKKIKEQTSINFPPKHEVHDNINILIHKKLAGRGKKKDEFDEVVSMSFSDFEKLLKMISNDSK